MDTQIEMDATLAASAVIILLFLCLFLLYYLYKRKLTQSNRLVVHTSSQASVAETGVSSQQLLTYPKGTDHGFSEQFIAALTRQEQLVSEYGHHPDAAAATTFPGSQFDSSGLWSVFTESASIVTEINSHHNNIARLAELIGADPILCLRVMTVANAAYYATGDTPHSIKYAIAHLGIETLKAVVVHELISRRFNEADPNIDTLKQLVRHSASCASCASYFGAIFPELDTSVLYTAGLFHDIGKFIILNVVQETPAACLRPYFASDARINDRVLWKYDHAAVGARALTSWNVDSMLCTLTQSHHLPTSDEASLARGSLAKYLMVLFIANQFSKYCDRASMNFLECIAPRMYPTVPINAVRALLANSNILMDLTRIHYLLRS